MKILLVNRNYFITGGPEKYMFSLMENMPQHRFIPFCVDFERDRETPYRKYFVSSPAGAGNVYFSDFKMSLAQKIKYGFNSIYHIEARRKLERLIRDEKPDLALFLNAVFFSDSIIDACRTHKVPIIWRMSDFHKVCPNYLLYRDGHVCEECLEHGLSRAIRNRCGGYQRSLAAAIIKVAGMWLARARRLYDHVDYFITPSAFTREKMIKGGFPAEKIVHIPTPVKIPEIETGTPSRTLREILYVGRLSHEKGIATLLEAFGLLTTGDVKLNIAGDDDSPFARELKNSIPEVLKKRINFLGFRHPNQLAELYKSAACIIVPSVWYENQPNTQLEGMAQGVPVIVSDHGSLKKMVTHGETGYCFKPGDAKDLADKIELLLSDPVKAREMGLNARKYVMNHHTMERHLNSLDELFNTVKQRTT